VNMAARAHDDATYDVDPGRGWITFAGVMLLVVGAVNLIYGIAALSGATFYAHGLEFVVSDLKTWGWVLTILGGAQMAIAYGVIAETEWGRWGGILVAGLNMLGQFLAIASHPAVSVLIFFVDVIIIFGLLTYGGRDRRSLAG
jgi:hypothetical protein